MGAAYDTSPQGDSTHDNPSGCTSGHVVNSRLQSGLLVELRDSTHRILDARQGAPGAAVPVSANVPGGDYYTVVKPVSTDFSIPQMYTLTRTIGAPRAPRNDPWHEGAFLDDAENGPRMAGTTFGATAAGHSTLTLDACNADYDTTLAGWSGCPSQGGRLIACNDDSCGLRSRLAFEVHPGQTVLFSVGGFLGAVGSGVLNLSLAPDCPADFNGDAFLDFFDDDDFVAAFEAGC